MTPTDPDQAEEYLDTLSRGLLAVGALTQQVKDLDDHVTISENTAIDAKAAAGGARLATKIAVGFACLALVAAGLALFSLHQNCLSLNSSRAASAGVWSVVLDAADSPHATKAEKARAKVFARYVQTIYRPHNCWAVFKSYQAPPKPDLRHTE